MNNKGFVTSALLYGILSLFLLLILSLLTTFSNHKLSNDKVKRSALDDVQNIQTDYSCFTVSGTIITDYSDACEKTVFIPEEINGVVIDSIGDNAFANKNLKNVTIKKNITNIAQTAFSGNSGILIIMKSENDSILGAPWGGTNATVRWDG